MLTAHFGYARGLGRKEGLFEVLSALLHEDGACDGVLGEVGVLFLWCEGEFCEFGGGEEPIVGVG